MSEKYVKGYFVLSRSFISDFLLFNVLFRSSLKKFKVLGSQILEFWVLSLGSWVPGPRSRVLGLGSRVLSTEPWVTGLRFQGLGPYLDCPLSLFHFNFYFIQYPEMIFKFCWTRLLFLLKWIFMWKHTQVCKFLVVAKTKQWCLINSKEIFLIFIWRKLIMFNFFILKWKRIK